MNTRPVLFCALVLALSALAGPAEAGGDNYARKTLTSNFGRCGSGMTQTERLLFGTDVHGLWESLTVACMADSQHASWAVVAKAQCVDEDANPRVVSNCAELDARKGVPLLFGELPYSDPAGGPQSLRVDYSLLKYAAGKDCQIVQVPDVVGETRAWDCKAIAFIDGTKDAAGLPISDPRQFRVRKFYSNSDVPFVVQYDPDKTLPIRLTHNDDDGFTFDASIYAR